MRRFALFCSRSPIVAVAVFRQLLLASSFRPSPPLAQSLSNSGGRCWCGELAGWWPSSTLLTPFLCVAHCCALQLHLRTASSNGQLAFSLLPLSLLTLLLSACPDLPAHLRLLLLFLPVSLPATQLTFQSVQPSSNFFPLRLRFICSLCRTSVLHLL